MALDLDIELTEEEAAAIAATDRRAWFTHVRFANGESPRHPNFRVFDENHRAKRALVLPWLERTVPGARVLDTFSANGAFSLDAARLGALDVLGVEFDEPRVECARLLAGIAAAHGWPTVPRFEAGDVYRLDALGERFDVTLCLGGLYHVADPAHVLGQLRAATREGGHLLLQTAEVLWLPGAWATFWSVGKDRTRRGLSSYRGGSGRWRYTPKLVDRLLAHAGFRVVERRFPALRARRRFRWYGCLAEAV